MPSAEDPGSRFDDGFFDHSHDSSVDLKALIVFIRLVNGCSNSHRGLSFTVAGLRNCIEFFIPPALPRVRHATETKAGMCVKTGYNQAHSPSPKGVASSTEIS